MNKSDVMEAFGASIMVVGLIILMLGITFIMASALTSGDVNADMPLLIPIGFLIAIVGLMIILIFTKNKDALTREQE